MPASVATRRIASPGEARAPNHVHTPDGERVVIGAYLVDTHDPRDLAYDRHTRIAPHALPRRVDLRQWFSPVEHQGHLGSCTANAIAGAYEYLERRANGGRFDDVSRLFIYYLERELEGTVRIDNGAHLRSGMKVLARWGICREKLWPYHPNRFAKRPPENAFREAKRHRIEEYRRVPIELHAMRSCLAEGRPFVFGTKVYAPFVEGGRRGRIPLPSPRERSHGGHAMVCVGYDDARELFIARNSWGPNWADGGYCYFPYAYLLHPRRTRDCWTLKLAGDLDFSDDPGRRGARKLEVAAPKPRNSRRPA